MTLSLVQPSPTLIPSYLESLRAGNFITMQLGFGDETASSIEKDPEGYLRKITNPAPYKTELTGSPLWITEHELLWLTDGKRFLGTVALRYKGDKALIDDYAGHIGLAIRPDLLNKGYGVRVIKDLFGSLETRAKAHGLTSIKITCDPQNRASRRLIEFFGGKLLETKPSPLGKGENALYQILLDSHRK